GLKRTPLFSDLSIDELMGVICKLNVCFVDMGDYVFRRGDEGQSIFVITSGAAEVISYTKYGEEVKYATLTDGDFFGEHEYFSGTTRSTEVRAVTDLELFKIKRNEMAALTARNPYMAKVLYDFYKERVLDKAMALSKVFKHMSIKDRREMLETVQVESYPPGTDIVKFNDKGENMFLIVSGTADVWRLGDGGEKITLSSLQENDYFGEVAMMLDRARTSNVTAVTTVDAILIGREHLDGVLSRYPIIKKVLEDVAMKHVKENEAPAPQ
ncbi:MAG: cyclic nucleotide-binding domain-containing protein, partial [Proteobacteria bacterium]|nr:cyclic nucleotide-binding domain-containing protein [Pseudomonadota bacterium]